MERQRPDTTSNEIELYIRTYYSVLRSSGEIRVRSFEETHAFSNSSLHSGAREIQPDLSTFGYAAARLPSCMSKIRRLVLGQSESQFENYALPVRGWERVTTPGRRRPLRYDGEETLAVFIASASDIDDLIPIITAYQIEWNKLHDAVVGGVDGYDLSKDAPTLPPDELEQLLARQLHLEPEQGKKLRSLLGADFGQAVAAISGTRLDLRLKLLAGSFSQYQRAAQQWYEGIEAVYLRPDSNKLRPVYFVSSNTHSLANLLAGYALAHQESILETAEQHCSPDLVERLHQDVASGEGANLLYFALRKSHLLPGALERIVTWDAQSGVQRVPDPGHVEVGAQIIELAKLKPERCDPRVRVDGMDSLSKSDAVIINIDYPLGMAAYQLLSRLGQGVGELLGVYVMGKAATLNGRVGDVMISNVVHDEHSKNTYLFRNAFVAADIEPYLRYGTVLDNQKALTVRSAFLQNEGYMGVFYREGYTALEMEAGPYMSALFELVDPRRHPNDEIVRLGSRLPFDVGLLHYASDTPYSRRQDLLSKSLDYFGMDSTYACATAITRRILNSEVARLRGSKLDDARRPA